MPESTLTIDATELDAAIGAHLGYGRGATRYAESAWTTAQANNITDLRKSALRQVYTPPPLAAGEPPHDWSFLRPEATLTLASGETDVPLPDDFGGFTSDVVVTNPAVAARRWPLRLGHEGSVAAAAAAQPDTTGAPRLACEIILPGTTSLRSTRSVLRVWPTADDTYTLLVRYVHHQDVLSGSYPYPPGGPEHAELYKASALAASELFLDGERGEYHAFFLERLAASVHADRKRKGNFIGYNGDGPNARVGDLSLYNRFCDNPPVTYNGTTL